MGRSKITNEDIAGYYRKHRDEIVGVISALAPHFKTCPRSPSIVCYVYMKALETDEAKATEWALGVAAGQHLSSQSPILLLRHRLLALRGQAHKLTQFEKLALAIKSWNAFYAGRSLGVLKWSAKQGKPDSFPTFVSAA